MKNTFADFFFCLCFTIPNIRNAIIKVKYPRINSKNIPTKTIDINAMIFNSPLWFMFYDL